MLLLFLTALSDSLVIYIVAVLGIFLIWWSTTMNPMLYPGGRSVFFFAMSLELFAVLSILRTRLNLSELAEFTLRAAVFGFIAIATTMLIVHLFRTWLRNEDVDVVIARARARRVRARKR